MLKTNTYSKLTVLLQKTTTIIFILGLLLLQPFTNSVVAQSYFQTLIDRPLVPPTTVDDPINWADKINNAIGTTTMVSTPNAFNNAAAAAGPGDVIIIQDGTYGWANLVIPSSGTQENPIIYTAETPGGVTFNTTQNLFKITGDWNIIGGFTITNPDPTSLANNNKRLFRVSNNGGTAVGNRLTDMVLNKPGSINNSGFFEITSGARQTRFDHNYINRAISFIRIDVNNLNTYPRDTRIDHNHWEKAHFQLMPGSTSIHNVTVMQVGQANFYPDTPAEDLLFQALEIRTVFEYNRIEDWYGRTTQILSIKSSHNIFRYNTWESVNGGIGIRYGNSNQVYGNIFTPSPWKGLAVFMYGSSNVVVNNIINRPSARGAISQGRWGTQTNGTFILETGNNLVAHNTVIANDPSNSNSRAMFRLGYTSNGATNPIIGSVLENNLMSSPGSRLFAFEASGCNGCTATNNLYHVTAGGSLGSGFDLDSNPIQGDPLLEDADFIPASNSPAVDAASPSPINIDFYGNLRGNNPDIGAVENIDAPLSINNEGFNNLVSIIPNPTSNTFVINVKGEVLENVTIYNQLGQLAKEVTTNEADISNLPNGIYFVKITTQSGKTTTKKVIKK